MLSPDAIYYAIWVAVVGAYGVMAKLAVTTSLNINFLRAAGLNDLVCEARVLKPGKRLAVGEATVHADGVERGGVIVRRRCGRDGVTQRQRCKQLNRNIVTTQHAPRAARVLRTTVTVEDH